jgi:hypothetical protein
VAFIATAAMAQSPAAEPFFARKNTFSFFGAYSNDSSPILLGEAENRKLLDIGAAYGRRLYLNRIVNWQYNGEILPVALESDPVVNTAMVYTLPVNVTFHGTDVPVGACVPSSGSITETQNGITYSFTYTNTCSRRWNIGEAMSPVGMQWNFLPRKKMQPFLIGHGGYMYSTQPIPIDRAGSFNFTFDLGAGIELYRSHTRSIRAEYRYHHISNHETAMENPGIDNGLLQVTYSFGH